MLDYFFSLSPYTTENYKTVFHQSFLYPISKRSINFFYWIGATPLRYVILGHFPVLNYFLSLSPYTTQNSKTVFHQSFLYPISKRSINFFYWIGGHTAVLCHIRPHSRCSTISSASAHTENNSLSAPNVTKPTTRSNGEIILTGNKQSTQRKKKPVQVPLCTPQIHNDWPGIEPGPP